MTNYHENEGTMSFPNPDVPGSGYVDRRHAIGHAAAPAPEGMTYVPSMGTWVDSDVAMSLGLGTPEGNPTSLDAGGIPEGHDHNEFVQEEEELSEEDLATLQEQLEIKAEQEPSLSETLDEIASVVDPATLSKAMDGMVETGNFEATIETLTEATGFDRQSAVNLIETVTLDAAPIAAEYVGEERWGALMYAASATPDKFARRVVADFVTGKLHPSKLMSAYAMWYNSLENADEE